MRLERGSFSSASFGTTKFTGRSASLDEYVSHASRPSQCLRNLPSQLSELSPSRRS